MADANKMRKALETISGFFAPTAADAHTMMQIARAALAEQPAQGGAVYTMDQMRAFADDFHQSRIQAAAVAYWGAVDSDDTLQMTMSADDANGGLAARQEVNDWINETIAEDGVVTRLVALYTAPPAPSVSVPMAPPIVFADWLRSNMPPDTIISDPDWWAMAIWSAARRAINAAPVAPSVPDGYTAVRTETLQWLLGERGDFVDLNPRNGKPRPYFWRSALREALLASGGKASVPDGWKLVPVEPTPDMTLAGRQRRLDGWSEIAILDAMLAAAPEPPRCTP